LLNFITEEKWVPWLLGGAFGLVMFTVQHNAASVSRIDRLLENRFIPQVVYGQRAQLPKEFIEFPLRTKSKILAVNHVAMEEWVGGDFLMYLANQIAAVFRNNVSIERVFVVRDPQHIKEDHYLSYYVARCQARLGFHCHYLTIEDWSKVQREVGGNPVVTNIRDAVVYDRDDGTWVGEYGRWNPTSLKWDHDPILTELDEVKRVIERAIEVAITKGQVIAAE
jgi:ethanolamine utilization protein EutQ (cupin superfamily)